MSVPKLMMRLRCFSNTPITMKISDLKAFTLDLGLNWASLPLHLRHVAES